MQHCTLYLATNPQIIFSPSSCYLEAGQVRNNDVRELCLVNFVSACMRQVQASL